MQTGENQGENIIVCIDDSVVISQELKEALTSKGIQIVTESTPIINHVDALSGVSYELLKCNSKCKDPYSGPPRNRHERRKAKSKKYKGGRQ